VTLHARFDCILCFHFSSLKEKMREAFTTKVEQFVRDELKDHDGSHDYWHIHRVRNNALSLAKQEGITSEEDLTIIEVSCLLHDVRDWKYSTEQKGSFEEVVEDVLKDYAKKNIVIDIVNNIGFKEELKTSSDGASTPEEDASRRIRQDIKFKIVSDADRLDAIGAIGIGRTFCFGGAKRNPMHDPNIKPNIGLTREEYQAAHNPGMVNTTINHFHEKLLKLKGLMKTESGTKMALKRHEVMERFLKDFHDEWEGL